MSYGANVPSLFRQMAGYVDRILVLVPDDSGDFSVATGGTYSYYEFHQPVSDRLTDEAWRAMLRAGEEPDRPAWVDPILRGSVR